MYDINYSPFFQNIQLNLVSILNGKNIINNLFIIKKDVFINLIIYNKIIIIFRLLEACRVLNFEPNFKPVILKRNEVSEILLRRIEHGNVLELG